MAKKKRNKEQGALGEKFKRRVVKKTTLQKLDTGNDLLSQDPSVQVPSALEGLTAVFGMGTGGTPPPLSPVNSIGFLIGVV